MKIIFLIQFTKIMQSLFWLQGLASESSFSIDAKQGSSAVVECTALVLSSCWFLLVNKYMNTKFNSTIKPKQWMPSNILQRFVYNLVCHCVYYNKGFPCNGQWISNHCETSQLYHILCQNQLIWTQINCPVSS